MPERSQTENIHQWISFVGGIQNQLSADRRHTDTVSVMGNALDHALDQRTGSFPRLPFRFRSAKPQRIHKGYRTCTHGEDIAQNSAHPSGSSLKRLHCAGMIVGLDLEGQSQTIPSIHHARILFSRLYQYGRAGGRKFFQLPTRVFVGAMLTPHDREHAEFVFVRLAAKAPLDPSVLLFG